MGSGSDVAWYPKNDLVPENENHEIGTFIERFQCCTTRTRQYGFFLIRVCARVRVCACVHKNIVKKSGTGGTDL
jgi:hypothetical protein